MLRGGTQGLDRASLSGREWRFRLGNGHVIAERLVLEADGRIGGYSHPNEAGWRLIDGALLFVTAGGAVSTLFDRVLRLPDGSPCFQGYFQLDPGAEKPMLHVLEPAGDLPYRPLTSVSLKLGDHPALLVIFNSAGSPFLGLRETHWEFHDLPHHVGIDALRFAEAAPAFWYMDKQPEILDHLLALARGRYRQVLLLGMSSGGYAAIRAAEHLARADSSLDIASFSINPQTVHNPAARAWLTTHFEEPQRSIVLGGETTAALRGGVIDLPDLLREDLPQGARLIHHVHFDSGNPSEAYHAGFLREMPRVQLHAHALGMDHAEGCAAIFASGQLQDAIIDTAYRTPERPVPMAEAPVPISKEYAMPSALPMSLPSLARTFAAAYDRSTGGYRVPPRHEMTQPFSMQEIEYWQQQCASAPQYDAVELEVAMMLYSLVRLTEARSILETGCSRGFSTSFLASGVVDNGGGEVISIDVEKCFHLWEGSEIGSSIQFLQMSSSDAGRLIPGACFDMLFLDSLHTYAHLLTEIMLFDKNLKVGGSIILHDTLFYDGLSLVAQALSDNPRFETVTLPTPRKHGFPSRCPGVTIATKISDDRQKYPFQLSQKYLDWNEVTAATGYGEERTVASKPLLQILREERL